MSSTQEERDNHYKSVGNDFLHRWGCDYCNRRWDGRSLPTIKIKLIGPDTDSHEIREMKDAADETKG